MLNRQVSVGSARAVRRMPWTLLSILPFLWMLVAAIDVTPASAEDWSNSGIVRDGIDTQSNTREGIDTRNNTRDGIDDSGIAKDGIDPSHADTGITDEGIDRGGLDDDTEHPDAPTQPQK